MNDESIEEEQGGIEDQTKWVHYFIKHFDSILEWIKEFSPSRYDLLLEKNKSEQFSIPEIQEILFDAWTFCEDSPRIRTGGFFHLCNLLDGGYLK